MILIYKIFNKTKHIYYELTIDQIICLIKEHPNDRFFKFIGTDKILIDNQFAIHTTFICHRINTVRELQMIPDIFGIELDIRDINNEKELFLSHDPYNTGELVDSYLQSFKHNILILNIKSERIEPECIEIMNKYGIHNYFFLDSNMPMIHLLNKRYKNKQIACRFSEYEPIEYYDRIKDMVSWVWVDCFSKQPLTKEIYQGIKSDDKRICIVSPELQGFPEKINEYRNLFIRDCILPDAICCKVYNIIHWL